MLDKPKHKKQFFRQMKEDITKVDDQSWYVRGSEKEPYLVFKSIHKGFLCDCMSFVMGNTNCKHIQRIKISEQS